MAAASPRRVTLGGLLRGRELEGDAMLTLDAESISLDTARGRISLALAQLDGIRVPGDVLELYLATGDVIQLAQAPDLNALATDIASSVCAIPEMTRSLRALGAGSLAAGEEHDRFFGPLLEARLLAERAPNLVALRAAFDAAALGASIEHVLDEIAFERYPKAAGERRALRAELADVTQGLLARLAELERAEAALGASDDGERFVRWRAWQAVLRNVFRSADSSWIAIHPVLSDDRRAAPSFWRRMFGRKKSAKPKKSSPRRKPAASKP
ncbi:MAG TPA: hypothetical protein VK617_08305 [Gemmatimonadaceae bacterium]|nr:hypothetical protein [Gemmatimonadaceae bacterium]